MALVDIVKKGSTSRGVPIYVFDNTTGLPKVDLTYVSTGIALWYRREGAVKTAITPADLSALTTAYASGGFKAVGDGEYRLDIPDAALATGANFVDFGGTFTGYTVVGGRVRLVDYDLEDGVRLGLTALPNAAAAASGGVPILGANTTAISFTGGMTISNATGSGLTLSSGGSNGNGLNVAGNGSGHGILTTGGATGNGVQATGGATSGHGIRALGSATAGNGIVADGNVSGHGLSCAGGSTTGNGLRAVGIAGTSEGVRFQGFGSAPGLYCDGGANGPGILVDGGSTLGAGIQVRTTSGDGILISPTVGHGINSTGNGTSKHGANFTGGTAGTSDGLKATAGTGGVDIRGELGSVLTEAYSTKNGTLTVAQALYELVQNKDEPSVSGVTLTTKKRDQSATAMTHTLNSGTAPTSRTRAT